MFSIAAINDSDSKQQWEPLAPTKEALEFHLTQTYHDGLLKLEAQEYDKARELLQAVLRDPIISSAQVDSTSGDSHLLQLRFLALKNLATVFLKQGSDEGALRCYLQAVEIDNKDTVIWNQLGTLSCSMGLLSISRWAFEEGLLCSPNNWNCMEKLLEVLIAIKDEVACLSVADLILRHWPSHSRALHVKTTIEEADPVPFAPRGVDKLEPRHVRLKFVGKRKSRNDNEDGTVVPKRSNTSIEMCLKEVSWVSLARGVIRILDSEEGSTSNHSVNKCRSGDTRVIIRLPPPTSESRKRSVETKGHTVGPSGGVNISQCNAESASTSGKRESHVVDEQPHERRSSRLESLRSSHKPGKEDPQFSERKDVSKRVTKFLKPFIICGPKKKALDESSGEALWNSSSNEPSDVINFVKETSDNYGAYHLGHLLLEKVSSSRVQHQDAFVQFLELEKLTRFQGFERSRECSLFLAELCYDLGLRSSNKGGESDFMQEVSYHLCKIIESVALNYPCNMGSFSASKSQVSTTNRSQDGSKGSCNSERPLSPFDCSFVTDNSSFWVRFYWLSGHISAWEDDRTKAYEEFCISLSLLENNKNLNDIPGSVLVSHCKLNKELTINRISHEINLLEVQLLMKKTSEMMEKEMYAVCIEMLAPILLSASNVHLDILSAPGKGEGFASVELSGLDVLIKACEMVRPVNLEVSLKCHQVKLHKLMASAGMLSSRSKHANHLTVPEANSAECWLDFVSMEVKAISQCASLMKSALDHNIDSNGSMIPKERIGEIQSLLLALMCCIAREYLSKKSCGATSVNQTEQSQHCLLFVEAATAFCKLHQLDVHVPIRSQVDLIVAIHDLLAEYGLCCAGEDGEGVDATFLKLGIKHLLAMDVRIKSIHQDKGFEATLTHGGSRSGTPVKELSDVVNMEVASLGCPPCENADHENAKECGSSGEQIENSNRGTVDENLELNEDEREELELAIDNALDQCFFCLYGLKIRSDVSCEDELTEHKNTSCADYQSKDQCADVFKYILPYAKASTKTGLVKLRRVLRAIRKHFPQPPEVVLSENPIDKYLDDPDLCEDKLSEEAGSVGFLESITKVVFPDVAVLQQVKISTESCEPYMEVYSNLYYLMAQCEETSATDKWPGFVLTKEGEDFVEQNANLSKYDLLFNPLRFESWERLANIYDEEVDLLLNDGSKHVNVAGWRNNATLPLRVETSRRRSRRCLLMSLALAKTTEQQGEIHELLALVYYDGVQNVVPFYDQRSVFPTKDAVWKMFCQNSMKHFKKAFAQKEDWSQAYYLGKLSEKLGHPPELSFSYYDRAIALNSSAVDPVYRIHASRMKLLYTCERRNLETLKVSAAYSFDESTKEAVMNVLEGMCLEKPQLPEDNKEQSCLDNSDDKMLEESRLLDNLWDMLYSDCLSALEVCIEGDLKHFHKARYMLARGYYKRGQIGDLDRAKDELSFCFKSSRSSFTVNMWEIDGMVKKGRRKTPGVAGNKRTLEVNLPESSRKFITCIRKYLLFYLKLLEESGDISTLDRAYTSIRTDKRFSLCLEDLIPVALGRYLRALVLCKQSGKEIGKTSPEQILEKIFSLFMEQGSIWADMCSLPDIKSADLTESMLYGYLHQHVYSLEINAKLDALEVINEKIRKRFKHPKLSNSNCARVCRHASLAWCRSLIINLALITPAPSSDSVVPETLNSQETELENHQLLCVDLQTNQFWSSIFGDPSHSVNLEAKWNPLLSKVKTVIIKKASEENLELANCLLRSAYSFYRDSSSVVLSSGVDLYWVSTRVANTVNFKQGSDGVIALDVSIPRKLLLWSYTLLHGHCAGITSVVKYCEENAKVKMKRGATSSSISAPSTSIPTVQTATITGSGGKDRAKEGETCGATVGGANPSGTLSSTTPKLEGNPQESNMIGAVASSSENQKILSTAPQLHHCNNNNSTASTEKGRNKFDLNDDAVNFEDS